jgi:hypothetical protein
LKALAGQSLRQPILVTGAHRSGTTWVGKMLAAHPQVAYISEPLNLWHRPGVLRAPVKYWYTYLFPENEADFYQPLQETIAFRYHLLAELGALRSRKDLLRMLRDGSIFLRGRISHQQPLLKDPFALFSAPWFARRLGCRVVILVRHPAAFASSLERLGWHFDFSHLLAQPQLLRDHLASFRPEMEKMLARPADVIAQACLLWRMVYAVVDQFRRKYPDFHIVRHEDLSRQPLEGFQRLYASLGLTFPPRVQKAILSSSSPQNPREGNKKALYTINLDSRANLANWQRRLDIKTIDRIRELTAGVSECFYTPQDWQ